MAALAAGAVTAPAASAETPCSTPPLCVETEPNGVYYLSVPPLSLVASFYPEVEPYADCLWERVEVDFGDGSPREIHVWDATQWLTGSHTFPAPGTYTVQIDATEGHHIGGEEPCGDFPLTATVTYPAAAPPTDPPGEPTDPPGGPWTPTDQGGAAPGAIPGAPDLQNPNAFEPQGTPAADRSPWRRCRGILAHGVRCRKARRIVKAAASRTRPGSILVAGFECDVNRGMVWPISCRRGEQRILAQLPPRRQPPSS